MKVILFANNRVGLETTRWLRAQGEEIVGLVIHPSDTRRHTDVIVAASGTPAKNIFESTALGNPQTVAALRALKPDIGVSAFFRYILRPDVIDLFPKGCVNIHPALLPYNRGTNPNIWSLVEETPSGATLHYIDGGVDTGDIVGQVAVPVTPTDTGETLYAKLEEACVSVLKTNWAAVRAGTATRTPQVKSQGSFHRFKDVDALDEIDLDKTTTARRLINILRARTFPPYDGAYIRVDGQKIFLRLQLYEEKKSGQ